MIWLSGTVFKLLSLLLHLGHQKIISARLHIRYDVTDNHQTNYCIYSQKNTENKTFNINNQQYYRLLCHSPAPQVVCIVCASLYLNRWRMSYRLLPW